MNPSNDSVDQLTADVLERVKAFVADLQELGVQRLFLRSGYSHVSSTVKSRKFFNGRTVVARKEKGLDIVFETFKAEDSHD